MKHRRAVLAATAGVAVLTGAGVADATGAISHAIPDANGVVHACYPTNGTLKPMYLIDTAAGTSCPPGYSALDFNQRGPQGAQGAQGIRGPQGVQGAQGAQGAAGAGAHVYSLASTDDVHHLSGGQAAVVGSVSVPAGSYAIVAKLDIRNLASFEEDLDCTLEAGDALLDQGVGELAAAHPYPAAFATQPLVATEVFPGPTSITVSCASTDAEAYRVSIAAIQVGGIN